MCLLCYSRVAQLPPSTYTHSLRNNPQGVYPTRQFNALGLPGAMYSRMEWKPPPGADNPQGRTSATLNLLKVCFESDYFGFAVVCDAKV